ncbi:hypothetical protein BDN72DRAFT_863061 [Pluteus cervinus]|uniref:Uncharacterized protein n=1 Tax=Pluteus cervinus TaxID=181527 RepID=A0ACD3A8F4_9AGAR|nr:hypothetical protein BDN72DRAFT_863061 [Pluteus cervinus]
MPLSSNGKTYVFERYSTEYDFLMPYVPGYILACDTKQIGKKLGDKKKWVRDNALTPFFDKFYPDEATRPSAKTVRESMARWFINRQQAGDTASSPAEHVQSSPPPPTNGFQQFKSKNSTEIMDQANQILAETDDNTLTMFSAYNKSAKTMYDNIDDSTKSEFQARAARLNAERKLPPAKEIILKNQGRAAQIVGEYQNKACSWDWGGIGDAFLSTMMILRKPDGSYTTTNITSVTDGGSGEVEPFVIPSQHYSGLKEYAVGYAKRNLPPYIAITTEPSGTGSGTDGDSLLDTAPEGTADQGGTIPPSTTSPNTTQLSSHAASSQTAPAPPTKDTPSPPRKNIQGRSSTSPKKLQTTLDFSPGFVVNQTNPSSAPQVALDNPSITVPQTTTDGRSILPSATVTVSTSPLTSASTSPEPESQPPPTPITPTPPVRAGKKRKSGPGNPNTAPKKQRIQQPVDSTKPNNRTHRSPSKRVDLRLKAMKKKDN